MEASDDLSDSFEFLSIEDSKRKQYLDRLKGFAYLETFTELEEWRENEVDALQRANTPLYKRPDTLIASSGREDGSPVMLIHDHAGGYKEYESCQLVTSDRERYSCPYLQWVDTFVYFSHKLVTIPPPTWINACHRSGVEVLGTFIVEPWSTDVERILEEDDRGDFWVAKRLARIAKHYGFDGWLINIETTFPLWSWSCEKLERFLRQLRHELGSEGKLVWYDAMITLGFIWYQNGLNHLNLPFALAAGSFLSNYAWTPETAQRSMRLAGESGLGVKSLYFGIDVWAQNVQRDLKHPRVTWPKPGGGGTGTGLGMRALQDLGFKSPGAGIFAPAWSFEHFPDIAVDVDKSMWLGQYLPCDWFCDCGPTKPHSAVPYQQNGITRYARQSVFGTDCFFHTDFSQAFSRDKANGNLYAQIGSQQPSVLEKKVSLMTDDVQHELLGHLSVEVRDGPPRCILKINISSTQQAESTTFGELALAELSIERKEKFLVSAKYRRFSAECCTVALVIETTTGPCLPIALSSSKDDGSTATAVIDMDAGSICGSKLRFSCDHTNRLPPGESTIVELYSLTIKPWLRPPSGCEPINVFAEHRGPAGLRHLRLGWDIEYFPSISGVPISDITGPCAYFTVYRNSHEIGRAYALEFIIPEAEAGKWKTEGTSVIEVTAIGFDSTLLGSKKTHMAWPIDYENDWVLLTPTNELTSFLR